MAEHIYEVVSVIVNASVAVLVKFSNTLILALDADAPVHTA